MTKEEFRARWESGDDGGGISFDDIAECARAWGISSGPKTRPIDLIRYLVLKAAGTNDVEEFKPEDEEIEKYGGDKNTTPIFTPERGKEIHMEIKKAVKTKQRLRLAIDGVSGSGKTYTALAVASGMGGPIIVIDSEHGSASLYADRFAFDTIELVQFQIEDYISALELAASGNEGNGYPVVVIDSTSHAWDGLVERVERIANQKFGGNTFRGWGEGTPLQKKLIEAMLNYPGHVIVTCRSKTEYSIEKNDKGATTIKKVGTAAVQRQGFEYEFTMAMTMDANHVGMVTKDRTSKFQDKFIEKPGKAFGQQLIAWLNEGAAPPPPPPKTVEQKCYDAMVEIGNILTGTASTGERFFSEVEVKAVKSKLAVFPKDPPEARLDFINDLLDEQKNLLQQRIEFLDSVAAGEGSVPEQVPASSAPPPAPIPPSAPTPAPVAPSPAAVPPRGETPPPVPSMYGEQEPEGTGTADTDDGFVDDIPESGPSKPSRKKNQPSLTEEFKKRTQEREAAKAAEMAAAAEANGELPIY
jgi:hypothetical protein